MYNKWYRNYKLGVKINTPKLKILLIFINGRKQIIYTISTKCEHFFCTFIEKIKGSLSAQKLNTLRRVL